MLLRLPFIVLDQNAFRKDQLLAPAIKRARDIGCKLLVLDAAIIEMTKNAEWELTTRKSFKLLAECPELVSFGRALPDLFRMERDRGRPCFSCLEDEEWTPALRALIQEIPNGDGPSLRYMRKKIAENQPKIANQYLDHARNKRRVMLFRDVWRAIFPGDDRRLLEDAHTRREALAHPFWAMRFEEELVSSGAFDRQAAQALTGSRSVTSHMLLASRALALRWYVNGGLNDNTKAEKLTNDVMDMEYVVSASFCDGIVSEEKKVNSLLCDLVGAAEIIAAR